MAVSIALSVDGARVSELEAFTPAGVDDARAAPELFARLEGQPVGKVGRMFADNKYHNFALYEWVEANARRNGELTLIGRRHLRSNNSWMHNCASLVKGPDRATALLHPADAARLGVVAGRQVRLRTRVGEVTAVAQLSDEMMPGVVSLPHGWGHSRPGIRLGVASKHAGASINDVTDEQFVDELTGTAALSGQRVTVRAVQPAAV